MEQTGCFQTMTWRTAPVRGPYPIDVRGVDFGEVLTASKLGDPSPWWAHVWPAGIGMAERLLRGPRLDGISCLDLGSGSGIVGVALGILGARVTFADQSPRALELSKENAERNALRDFELVQLDWDEPPARTFARVYAADVLYDANHLNALMGAFHRLIARDGVGYLADPKRQPVGRRLFGAAMDAGFELVLEEDSPEFLLARVTFAP